MAKALARLTGSWSWGTKTVVEILTRVVAGEIRAVVGEVVAFEDLPDAIDAMANRATIGRTIVKVEWPD